MKLDAVLRKPAIASGCLGTIVLNLRKVAGGFQVEIDANVPTGQNEDGRTIAVKALEAALASVKGMRPSGLFGPRGESVASRIE